MRRIIRFLIGLMGTLGAIQALAQTQTPIPVTGNLTSILGTGQAYAGVSIQLQNCPSPISIVGQSVIVQTGYQVQANPSGVINTTIWSNDIITCNGTTGNSQYQLSYVANGAVQGTPKCYQVVSTQIWNLNVQQPVSCSGSAPNPFTSCAAHNLLSSGCTGGHDQPSDFINIVAPGGTFTGPITAPTTNGIINAEEWPDIATAFAQLSVTQRQVHSNCAVYPVTVPLTLPAASAASTTGSITLGSNQLTVVSTRNLTAAGIPLTVAGAGAGGTNLNATVVSVNGLVVTISVPAATPVVGAVVTGTPQGTSLIGSNENCVIFQAQADTVDTTGSIANGTNTLTVTGTAANYPAGTPIHITDGVNTFDSWSLQFVGQVVTLADNATHTFTGASVKGTLNILVQNLNAEIHDVTIDCNGHPVIGINSKSSAIPDHVKFRGGCAVSFYEYGDTAAPNPGVFYNTASNIDIDGSSLSTVGVVTWTHGPWPSVGWVGLNDLNGVTKVRGLVQTTGSCSASVNPTQLTMRDPWQAYYMVNHAASITVIGAAAASADLFTTATSYSGNVVTLASPCLTTVTGAAVHTSPGTMNCGVYNGSGGRIKYATLDVEAQPIIGACNDYGILIIENGDLEQNTKGAFFNNPASNLNSGYFLNGASSIKANATLANAQTVNATGTIPASSNQLTIYGSALTPGTVYSVAGATFTGTNANYERVLSWDNTTGIATMASPTTGGGGSGTIPVQVFGPITPNYNQGGGFPAGYSSETQTESTKYTGSMVMRSPVLEGNGQVNPVGTALVSNLKLNATDWYWGAAQAQTTTFHFATGYNLATATYSSGGTSCGPDGNNAVFYVGGSSAGVYMGVIAVSGGVPTGPVSIVNAGFNVSGTLTVKVAGCTGNTTLTYTTNAPYFYAPTVKAGALISANSSYMIQIQPASDGQSVQLRGSYMGNYVTTGSMSSTVNPTFLTLPTALICRQMAQDASITVSGAGAAGANLTTTPASPTCSGAVMTLSSPALTTVSGVQVQGPTYPDINMGTAAFTQFAAYNDGTVAFPNLTGGGTPTLAVGSGIMTLIPTAISATPPWLNSLGSGADGAISCTGNLSGEKMVTTFTVPFGSTCTVNSSAALHVRATGACSILGTLNLRGNDVGAKGNGSPIGGGCGGGSGGGTLAGSLGQIANITMSTTQAVCNGGTAGAVTGGDAGDGGAANAAALRVIPYSGGGTDGIYLGGADGRVGGSSSGQTAGLGGGGLVLSCASITGTDGTHTGTINGYGSAGTAPTANSTGAPSGGGGGVVILNSIAAVGTWPTVYVGPSPGSLCVVPQAIAVGGTCTTSPRLSLGVSAGAFDGTAAVVTAGAGCGTGTGLTWQIQGGGGTQTTAAIVPTWSGGAVASATVTVGDSAGYTAATFSTCGKGGAGGPGSYVEYANGVQIH